MTIQVDTAAEIVRAFAEDRAVTITRQQRIWFASLVVEGWTASMLADFARENDVDFTEGQCQTLKSQIDAASDRNTIQRLG